MQDRREDIIKFCLGQFSDTPSKHEAIDSSEPLLKILESGNFDRNATNFDEVSTVISRAIYELETRLYEAKKLTEASPLPEGITAKNVVEYARRISPSFSRRYMGIFDQEVLTYNFIEQNGV